MARPGFEHFDHTADMGIRVFAPSLAELVEPAVRGLYACIGELVGGGEPAAWTFERAGDDEALLLRDFLQEVLMLFENRGRLLDMISVEEYTASRLCVRGTSLMVDGERSVYYREVKAITYHELAVRRTSGGVEASLIVDI